MENEKLLLKIANELHDDVRRNARDNHPALIIMIMAGEHSRQYAQLIMKRARAEYNRIYGRN